MIYDGVFPTRDGDPSGTANERTMLDKVGSKGIRTELRNNDTGGITMLRTRAGNPEFTNKREEPIPSLPIQKCFGPYGFVDTKFSLSGFGDETGSQLSYLIDETGAVESETKTKIKDSHAWKDAFHSNLPSNYSGLMRRIMQVEHAVLKLSERNDFSCAFSRSHGLYINQATGKRWLIEVNSSGVYRIPLNFCKEITSSWAEYLAYEASLFAEHSYEDATKLVAPYWRVKKIRIGESVKIGDAPECYTTGYTPLYDWCGWAFDYTGQKATIVLVRQHPLEPTWYQSAVFDMNISASGDDGIPSYTLVAKSDEAILASNINDYEDNLNAFVQVPAGIPGACCTMSLFSPVNPPITKAPLFSFYEASGAKKVYYFESYPASSGTRYSGNYGNPTTVTITRTGAWTYSTLGSMNSSFPIPDTTATPVSYGVNVLANASGIYETKEIGTFGGWAGIYGPEIPNQNTDRAVAETIKELFKRESGFCSTSQGITGIRLDHSSRCTYVGAGHYGWLFWNDLYPSGEQNNVSIVCQATAVILATSSQHGKIITHHSTLIISGYDRESIAFAHSETKNVEAYSISGTWDDINCYVQIDGNFLYSRTALGSSFSSECGPAAIGTTDWCNYEVVYDSSGHDTGLRNPAKIQGFYTFDSLVGYVGKSPRLYGNLDCTYFNSVTPVSEYRTATVTTTRTLHIRVAGQSIALPFEDYNIHRFTPAGSPFRFWVGGNAFPEVGNRYFYSKEINNTPIVSGVGAYGKALRGLFGFIGVF